jgi:hypothetical protein
MRWLRADSSLSMRSHRENVVMTSPLCSAMRELFLAGMKQQKITAFFYG